MSVLDPRELQASPLADLHALASELGLEGFRRLRKQDLINQIVEAQGGSVAPAVEEEADDPEVALYEDAAPEADEANGAHEPDDPAILAVDDPDDRAEA